MATPSRFPCSQNVRFALHAQPPLNGYAATADEMEASPPNGRGTRRSGGTSVAHLVKQR